jgi:hypothetical protein
MEEVTGQQAEADERYARFKSMFALRGVTTDGEADDFDEAKARELALSILDLPVPPNEFHEALLDNWDSILDEDLAQQVGGPAGALVRFARERED